MTIGQTVYVWVLNWTEYLDKKALCYKVLSFSEINKTKKFLCQYDQDRFVITRGLLRILISRFIDSSPKQLQFTYNEFGKPKLLGNELMFNLSHSKDWVAYAFCKNRKLGIDIEYQKNNLAIDNIAKRYFVEDEAKVLNSLDQDNKSNAFFNAWVQKEAIIKAFGLSLDCSLSQVSIDIEHLLRYGTYKQVALNEGETVLLYSFNVPSQFKGALAVLTSDECKVIQGSKEDIF